MDAIIRFTPLEWLVKMRPKRWQGYFDTTTVSCNHPIAIYAQTKRFPFVWDILTRKTESVCLSGEACFLTRGRCRDAREKEGYIFKPAYGRVGEKIGIPEACSGEEYRELLAEVKRSPKKFLAQKRFQSRPLEGKNGEAFHLCLGSYTVDGAHAPATTPGSAERPGSIPERRICRF